MMNLIAKQILATTFAGAVFSLASVTSAQVITPVPLSPYDAKVHHGSECQPNFSTFASSLVYQETGISTSAVVQVVCPIVRDNTSNTTGTVGVEIYVTNVTVAPNQNHLACTLYSYDTYDSIVAQSAPAIALVPGKQTLKVDVNASKAKGHYSMRCLMPPGSKLHAYEVREWLNSTVNRTDWFN